MIGLVLKHYVEDLVVGGRGELWGELCCRLSIPNHSYQAYAHSFVILLINSLLQYIIDYQILCILSVLCWPECIIREHLYSEAHL